MLGMTKRTCHSVFDRSKKRMLYLTLVRSNFEHCSTIWRPVTVVYIRRFEALQKRAIKWINCEEANSYSDEIYAITVVSHIYAYDRAKTLSFILLIRRKNTELENESNV